MFHSDHSTFVLLLQVPKWVNFINVSEDFGVGWGSEGGVVGVEGGGEWELADEVYYFAGVGVALGARLGVDFAVVGGDFEAAFFASDEGDGF